MTVKFTGNTWQQYANQLIATEYRLIGSNYQPVPSKVAGDHGLEGFSLCGHAYQCYADEDSPDEKQRTRKQKKKITQDLNKLYRYRKFWSDTLGSTQLKKWTLMVPDFCDKAVLKHARQRAQKLVEKNLPFIAPGFQALVETADLFPRARAMLKSPSAFGLSPRGVTDGDFQRVHSDEPQFIANLSRKTRKMRPGSPSSEVEKQVRRFLQQYLEGENLLDDLRLKFPSSWEDVDKLRSVTAAAVANESFMDDSAPSARYRTVRIDLEQKLRSAAGFFTEADLLKTCLGTMSRWLGDCTLDFAEPMNGGQTL